MGAPFLFAGTSQCHAFAIYGFINFGRGRVVVSLKYASPAIYESTE